MKMLRDFFKEEDGMGTIEIVLIIAVLVCIVLIFREAIVNFVKGLMNNVFDENLGNTLKETPAS